MRMQRRIERLEKAATAAIPPTRKSLIQIVFERQTKCDHSPGSKSVLFRDHAFKRPPHQIGESNYLITKVHCNVCSYETPMWYHDIHADERLTADERRELVNLSYYDQSRLKETASLLIEMGRLDFVAWPPPDEILNQFRYRRNDNDADQKSN